MANASIFIVLKILGHVNILMMIAMMMMAATIF